MVRIALIAMLLPLAGCATQQVEYRFDRYDGKAIETAEMERVRAECRATAIQASSQTSYQGPGLGGAIMSAQMQRQAAEAAAEACLARNGIRATPIVKPAPPQVPS
jgi:7-keto-8-aminopelargonate synthetase-like enzyme